MLLLPAYSRKTILLLPILLLVFLNQGMIILIKIFSGSPSHNFLVSQDCNLGRTIILMLGMFLHRLLRLLDQRFKGIALGVGQSEILGRIHVAPIKVIYQPGFCVCIPL